MGTWKLYEQTASVTEMLKVLNWRTLEQRRADVHLALMCKTANNLVAVKQVCHYKPTDSHSYYCTHLPTHLISKTQYRTPNFSGSVDSAAKIQTATPNVMKCLISFPNVAILTTSCLKHSIVSKTSIENPF